MPRIQSLTRRRKASAAVGTPGLDLSTAQMFNSLANSTVQIAAQIEKNRAVTDEVSAIKEAQTTNELNQKGVAEIQARYNADSSLDIADGIKEIDAFIQKTNTDRLAQLDNKRVRNNVNLKQERQRIKDLNAANAWGLKLQAINLLSDGTRVVNSLATQAEVAGDFNTFISLLGEGKANARAVAAGLSAKQGVLFVNNTPKSIAGGYLNGKMKQDPVGGLEEFKSEKIFSEIFDSDERKDIEKEFAQAITGKNILTNIEGLFNKNGKLDETAKDLKENNLDPVKIKNRKDELEEAGELTPELEKTLDFAIELSRTKKYLTSKDNVEFESRIISEYKDLQKSIKDDANDVGLERMLTFKNKVWEAMDKELINGDKASTYLSLVDIPIDEKARVLGEDPFFSSKGLLGLGFLDFSKESPNVSGIRRIENYLKSENISETKFERTRVDMVVKMLSELQKLIDNGVTITEKTVSNVVEEIIPGEATKAKLEPVSEKGTKPQLDPLTGKWWRKLPNGEYEQVE